MKFNIEYHVFQQDAVEKMLYPIVMGICSHGLDTGAQSFSAEHTWIFGKYSKP